MIILRIISLTLVFSAGIGYGMFGIQNFISFPPVISTTMLLAGIGLIVIDWIQD